MGARRQSGLALLVSLAGVLTALGGCDALGNPPLVVARTEPARWSGGPLATTTVAEAAPPDRWEMLIKSRSARLSYADDLPPPGGVMALVSVQPHWTRPVVPAVVPLLTQIELEDGRVVQRSWSAPGDARVWQAGFALPSPPRQAVTALR